MKDLLAQVRKKQSEQKARLESLNPTPRSPNHGKHRRPSPKAHRSSVDRTNIAAATWGTYTTFAPEIYTQTKPPAIPYAGIRAGELIGYRAWLVTEDYALRSLAHHFIWEPRATIEGKINEEVGDPYQQVFRAFANKPPLLGGVYTHFTLEQTRRDVLDDREFPISIETTGKSILEKMHEAFVYGTAEYKVTYITCIGFALGSVKLWGEVVEHKYGYRAQYAKLVSLDEATSLVDLERLKAKYV